MSETLISEVLINDHDEVCIIMPSDDMPDEIIKGLKENKFENLTLSMHKKSPALFARFDGENGSDIFKIVAKIPKRAVEICKLSTKYLILVVNSKTAETVEIGWMTINDQLRNLSIQRNFKKSRFSKG
jgi:hypothetical protein